MGTIATMAERQGIVDEARRLAGMVRNSSREMFLQRAEILIDQFLEYGVVSRERTDPKIWKWILGHIILWRNNATAPTTQRFWQLMLGMDKPPPKGLHNRPPDARWLKFSRTGIPELWFNKRSRTILRKIHPDGFIPNGDEVWEVTIWWWCLWEWRGAIADKRVIPGKSLLMRFIRLQKSLLLKGCLPVFHAWLIGELIQRGKA